MSNTARPKVAFIGTGGTISSLGIHPLELQDYGVHDKRMHASQIVARFPVVEEIADLWALERAGVVSGLYHVLGGHLSPLDGIGPDRLNIARLIERAIPPVGEVLLALNATVEGQSTAHYLREQLAASGIKVSVLQQGVPVGGELDYLDEGTLSAAIRARRTL